MVSLRIHIEDLNLAQQALAEDDHDAHQLLADQIQCMVALLSLLEMLRESDQADAWMARSKPGSSVRHFPNPNPLDPQTPLPSQHASQVGNFAAISPRSSHWSRPIIGLRSEIVILFCAYFQPIWNMKDSRRFITISHHQSFHIRLAPNQISSTKVIQSRSENFSRCLLLRN